MGTDDVEGLTPADWKCSGTAGAYLQTRRSRKIGREWCPRNCPRNFLTEIRRVGRILVAGEESNVVERIYALQVLNNWRAIHGYPLNNFQNRLRWCAKLVDKDAVISQRIKRVPSIMAKLSSTKLDRVKLDKIQDIAGCRAVVKTVKNVYTILERFYDYNETTGNGSYGTHKRIKVNDRIAEPKADGYRSLHLVYEYCVKGTSEHNELKIEIQLRTKLQHAWSTAVETVDAFTGSKLKAGESNNEWGRFFKLASAAFAMIEGTRPVDLNIGYDTTYLRAAIKDSMEQLNVEDMLRSYNITMNFSDDRKANHKYYLLVNYGKGSGIVRAYKYSQFKFAMTDLVEEEKHKERNAVLVGVESFRELKKAYPNYLADTEKFIDTVKRFVSAK